MGLENAWNIHEIFYLDVLIKKISDIREIMFYLQFDYFVLSETKIKLYFSPVIA